MLKHEREPEFKGTFIEVNGHEEEAKRILDFLKSHGIDGEYMPAQIPQDQDFVFYGEQLPKEVRTKLADSTEVSYIWDDPGTKAWVETVTILNNSTNLLDNS